MYTIFKKLGLSTKEIDAFLAMLELGPQPISVIAKQIKIPRSTMYLVLERLRKNGLVEEFSRSGIKYASCIEVDQIPQILEIKQNRIGQLIEEIKEITPELQKLENKMKISPMTRLFEGKDAVQKLYESVLTAKEFYAYQNPEKVKKFMPKYYDEIPLKIAKRGIIARELLISNSAAIEYKKKYQSARHRIRLLKSPITFSSDTIITEDRIIMISYGKSNLAAIEIYNQSLTETQKSLFMLAWEASL